MSELKDKDAHQSEKHLKSDKHVETKKSVLVEKSTTDEKSTTEDNTPTKPNNLDKPNINKNPRRKRLKIAALGCLVVLVIAVVLSAVAAAALKPEITTGSLQPESIIQEFAIVNSSGNYPKITLQEEHQIFVGEKLVTKGKEYTLSEGDLQEGKNKIAIRKIKDMVLFWQVSQEKSEIEIVVDRVAPELSVTEPAKKYYLLEDVILEIKGEPAAKVFLGDAQLGQLDNLETKKFSFKPNDGVTDLQVYAMDTAGNKSKVSTFKIDAFQKPGWEIVTCGGVKFPIDRAAMQIGYSGIRAENGSVTKGPVFGYTLSDLNRFVCEKNAAWVRIEIMPKNAIAPCVACDAGPSSIFDFGSAKSDKYDPKVGIVKQSAAEKVTKSEEFTTRSGFTGKLIASEMKNELEGGTYKRNYFMFVINNRIYTFGLNKVKDMETFKTIFMAATAE